MQRTTSDGKQVKITRARRLYIDGVLTRTYSCGALIADRVTPLNLPDISQVGEEIFKLAHEWAFGHYRMS
jgi:hypothetical protein